MNLGLSYVRGFSLSDNIISPDEKSSGFALMQEDRVQTQLHTLKAVHDLPPSYTFSKFSATSGNMYEPHTCFTPLLAFVYVSSLLGIPLPTLCLFKYYII